MIFFRYLFLVVGVLIGVAFIVLFERRILGYIQIRKGPNKVGFLGLFQSFGDAIKLFIKEQIIPIHSNFIPFYFSPVFSLITIIVLWMVLPTYGYFLNLSFGVLLFFCCTRFGVYTLIARGWSSNSNYALLGAIRGVAQTISYEVSLALIFISFLFLIGGISFYKFRLHQNWIIFLFLLPLLFLC